MNVYGGPGRAQTTLLPPGVCLLCRNSPNLETDTIFEGRQTVVNEVTRALEHVYICAGCVGIMATELGWVTPNDYAHAQAEIERVEHELKKSVKAVNDAEALLLLLKEYGTLEPATPKKKKAGVND